ncbi:unnamed protein product [Rotaria sordida]|uniref:Insulin-like domain-containing protein n=1 Tax=Rotaria sordida TaxID=392033 RepID=A0A819GEH3_9BILA|nr:unnamed protein product [Rotaria sordida]CAF0946777.1 unnamed protein product [Rotaria sordida]CAF0969087.1 unnamed protein product [Rotaria sordida]CAF0983110.1 unnamed protein product [Rotaria sordida]CAF0991016.1 unnamed protein product [Rotaria sordida]
MPANITDSNEKEDHYGYKNTIFSRQLDNKIKGTTQHIKSLGIHYRQVVKDGQCAVEYDGQVFVEGSLIKVRKKLFRIEDCLLERVYHACGPKLLLMLSVVCRLVEQHKIPDEILNLKRSPDLSYIHHLDSTAYGPKRVIAESCCENHCNVSELTRYCH